MRILQVAGSGGVGTHEMGPITNDICQLSNQFVKLGHEVVVADVQTTAPRFHLSEGVKVLETQCIPRQLVRDQVSNDRSLPQRISQDLRNVSRYWANEHRFLKQIRSQVDLDAFDIIHVHEWRPALILKKLYKTDFVYTAHTPNWCFTQARNGYKGRLRRIQSGIISAMGVSEQNTIRRSALTIALGGYLKAQLGYPNIERILNGTNPSEWQPIDKQKARKALGYGGADFVCLFVGRITENKGVDVLVKAVRSVASELANLRVVVIGSFGGGFHLKDEISPYAQGVIEQAKGFSVDFKGFVNNRSEAFRLHLAAADLFILPSLVDHQPNVVLEALVMGLPVLAARIGGTPQMVTKDVGVLFEPGNDIELAEKLRYLYHSPQELASMRRHCSAHVEQNFTWRVSAERHLEAFEKCMQR